MKIRLVINASGKAVKKIRNGVRPSLPYHAIARRAIQNSYVTYDREIDVSAVVIK